MSQDHKVQLDNNLNLIPNNPVTIMRLLEEATPRNPAPGFLKSAVNGVFRWDLLLPFPKASPDEQWAGDLLLKRQAELLLDNIDPTAIDAEAKLPPDFVSLTRRYGLQKLMLPKSLGGEGVSPYNMARLIELTASWCTPVAMSMSVNNYLGTPSYLPFVRDEAARQDLARRVVDGAISGIGAVEPQGASNPIYQTTAVPDADGSHFIINGDKCYIGNGPIADLVVLPCTTYANRSQDEIGISVFIVDTRQPGFSVLSDQTYMGLKGLANASLRFSNCRVPANHIVGELGKGLNVIMANDQPNRMFINAISLAATKLSLSWLRNFSFRSYMEQPLWSYQLTQRTIADVAAKAFAQESVMNWLTLSQVGAALDLWIEWTAMKPWSSECVWSALDSTMTLLAGRGYETARSLAQRGMPPYPVERLYRDLRVMRIFGTTNELLFLVLGNHSLMGVQSAPETAARQPDATVLSPANSEHLRTAAQLTASISDAARTLVRRGGLEAALVQQPAVVNLGRALSLVWASSVVLARAETEGKSPEVGAQVQSLADLYCRTALTEASAAISDALSWNSELSNAVTNEIMLGSLHCLADDVIVKPPRA